jgi:hypothetical protein
LTTAWCALTTIAIIYPGIGTAHPDDSLPEGFEHQRLEYTLSQVIPLVVMILIGLLFYALGAPTRRQAARDAAASQAVAGEATSSEASSSRDPLDREASTSETPRAKPRRAKPRRAKPRLGTPRRVKPRPVKRPIRPAAVWLPVPPSRAR